MPQISILCFLPSTPVLIPLPPLHQQHVHLPALTTPNRSASKLPTSLSPSSPCHPSPRFSSLFQNCMNGISTAPFGVNPHFLPSSSLYLPDAYVALNDSLTSADVDTMQPIATRPDGVPYGFQVAKVSASSHQPLLASLFSPASSHQPLLTSLFSPASSRQPLLANLARAWCQANEKANERVFPVIFDINLDNEAATQRLQYLADSFFIDNATQSVSVAMLTYNDAFSFSCNTPCYTLHPPTTGDSSLFVYTTVKLNFEIGGKIAVTYNVDPVDVELYSSSADCAADCDGAIGGKIAVTYNIGGKIAVTYNVDPVDVELYSSSADWVRLTVSVLYVCAVVWNLIEELVEAFQCWLETSRITSYFRTLWNWLDVLSLTIQFIGIIMWFIISVQMAGGFQVQPRYDIYVTGDSPFVWRVSGCDTLHVLPHLYAYSSPSIQVQPRYDIYVTGDSPFVWRLQYPPVGYKQAQAVYDSIRNLVQWRSILVSLQGINVFLFLLRLLKLMDFQPRIAILTRTMAAAFPALVHFFLLWAIMFIGFSLYAYVVFGRTLEQFQFSTVAMSMVSCFLILISHSSTGYYFIPPSSCVQKTLPLPPIHPSLSPFAFSTVAMSMVSCFLILINDNSTGYYFIQLEGWNLTAAIIFWVAYISVMVFVMLNVLIAIVVDAFLEVRVSFLNHPNHIIASFWEVQVPSVRSHASSLAFPPVPTVPSPSLPLFTAIALSLIPPFLAPRIPLTNLQKIHRHFQWTCGMSCATCCCASQRTTGYWKQALIPPLSSSPFLPSPPPPPLSCNQKSTEESPAFPVDMWYVLRNVLLRLSTDYWKPGRLQQHLLMLGAEDVDVTLEDSVVAKSAAALKEGFNRVNKWWRGFGRSKLRARRVLRVGKRCLNADALLGVLERCAANKPPGSDSVRRGFSFRRQVRGLWAGQGTG
ncbi:unnamed protein product [Closterium sp. NIES-65]|nr:unnamed protein product [Closterium sp. NIES-65]